MFSFCRNSEGTKGTGVKFIALNSPTRDSARTFTTLLYSSPPLMKKAGLPYSHSEIGLVFYQAESVISLGKK
jgi:hypothetical protein